MIVIGCGKAKSLEPGAARDLYTGSLFRAARQVAEASGQRWLILSAEHGVIEPDVWLSPYEHRLNFKGERLRDWAAKAAAEIDRRRAPFESVELLAGAAYADPIAAELEARGVKATSPLAGLGIGARLGRLKGMAETLQMLRRHSAWEKGTDEMRLDEETVKFIRDEARDDGDDSVVRACTKALEGDAASIAIVEETIRNRVGRAHRAHCRRGQASILG